MPPTDHTAPLRREPSLPPQDEPLRDDVRRLGALVGEMLAEQVSPGFLDEVERVRTSAIARRERDLPPQPLAEALAGFEPAHAELLVRAFGSYFQMVNIAERVHRIRRRRDYQRAGAAPQPGGLQDVLQRLRAEGVGGAELAAWLPRIDIEPVFTAHPTEAVRRTLLEKEQVMVASLIADLDGQRTPGERASDLARLRMALTSAWQTPETTAVRMNVQDEREHVGFYLAEVLYRVVPVFYEVLETALVDAYPGEAPELPRLLRFGSWVGGDMDGNPNVDAGTIAETLRAQRAAVLARHGDELGRLARLLSQSLERVAVDAAVTARVADYRALLPQAAARLRPRHADMPYRQLLKLMRARVRANAADMEEGYPDAAALCADLQLVMDSLRANRGLHAGWFAVRRLLWRVRTFGFHLARLDVRQDARVHARVVSAALQRPDWDELDDDARARLLRPHADGGMVLPDVEDDDQRRLDAVLSTLAGALRDHGPEALGVYVISMAQGAADVLAVLALARRGGLADEGGVPLDVAPLLETVDDLRHGAGILRALLADPVYRQHLGRRGNVQLVMLGYSDSSKDGGIAASRWALQRAQVELLEVARQAGIRLTFFHGRGGSISRGGGKTSRAVEASPRGSVDGRLRVTEQGEVIHRKYGIRALALRTLEQTTGAVLHASLRPRRAEPREADWRARMDVVAAASSAAYRDFTGDADFVAYFRGATPIDVIERMTLGSRPPRRAGSAPSLDNLRAIPWVFAWTQCRAVVPGWFGIGSGLQAAAADGGIARLEEMATEWPFFRTLLDDVAMVLAKCDMAIAELFSRLSGPLHEAFFPRILAEHALARDWVLRLQRAEVLLADDRRLAESIRLRNPYVDPMSLLQVDLLRRWRESDRNDDALLRALRTSVNGVAQGLQNTG